METCLEGRFLFSIVLVVDNALYYRRKWGSFPWPGKCTHCCHNGRCHLPNTTLLARWLHISAWVAFLICDRLDTLGSVGRFMDDTSLDETAPMTVENRGSLVCT